RQRNRDRNTGRTAGAVLLRNRVLAQGSAPRSNRGVTEQNWDRGRPTALILLSLRSRDWTLRSDRHARDAHRGCAYGCFIRGIRHYYAPTGGTGWYPEKGTAFINHAAQVLSIIS